jgi:superfamily II DNA/RNA helicase
VDTLRKGVEILVGTPGRLLDLARSKRLKLHRVRALVLDEAGTVRSVPATTRS